MEQKIYSITFGNINYNEHLKRIEKEMDQFKIIEKKFIYTDNDLINYTDFWNKHGDFIINNQHKGYGYWLWKAYLIKKTMKEINDNDIIVYTDAGCEWNINGYKRFQEYINILNNSESNILSFHLEHLEKTWTKMDLINELNAYDKLNTLQMVGGIFLIKKSEKTVAFIEEWCNLMCNYHFLDDSPSILPNDPSFIEHRHDQSCFSLLCKKYGSIVLKDETNRYIWQKNEYTNFPIYRKL